MDVPVRKAEPMSVEQFFAFTDTPPDHEKWELIDGEPVLQARPCFQHQTLVATLDLPSLGVSLPLAEIYQDTELA